MGNRVGKAVSFLAILVAVSVGGAGIALSQTLSLDDQSAMDTGETVTFTLSIDYPSSQSGEIQAVTINVSFDHTVLTYDSHTRGSLVAGWPVFDVSNPQDGQLTVAGLTFTAGDGLEPGDNGAIVQLQFTVDAMDDSTLTITAQDDLATFAIEDGEFTFDLPPANSPPVVGPITVNSQGEAVVIDVLGHMSVSDPDGDALTVSVASMAANGTVVNNNDGTITYTPNPGFIDGSDNFTYTVSDGMDAAGPEMITVNVTEPPNNAPMPEPDPDPAMTDAGESVTIRVSDYVSDPDGDTLTVSAVSLAANGTVVNNDDGTFTYTPNDGYSGEDMFTFTVSDGAASADVTVTITVEAAEAPVDPGDGDMDGEKDGDTRSSGGGGCTLNPGAPFDPTLLSILALLMGVHFVRRFARRQSLR